jgi:peptide/nickel transport system permease protein
MIEDTTSMLRSASRRHPIARMITVRSAQGIATLLVVSILIFWTTQILPGNAANAVLGRSATPESLKAIENQLGLSRPLVAQYWEWLTGLLSGHPGTSLVSGQSVGAVLGHRILNSLTLLLIAGVIGTLLGVGMGLLAAVRRDRAFDHISSIVSLVVTALPEFVIAVALILLLSTKVFRLLPAAAPIPPGQLPWAQPRLLVLPVLTLVVVIVPYIFRMMRAVTIDALESEYVQTARLKGVPEGKVVFRHALPNALPPTVQAIALTFLYLAGGIVLVEVVFNYPGLGQGLLNAVSNRDIPVIQATVMLLAAFYVAVNIIADVITLVATPRRRIPR